MNYLFKSLIICILLGIIISILILCFPRIAQPSKERPPYFHSKQVSLDTVSVKWKEDPFVLKEANVYNELVAQGIDFPKIVLAQAILETGNFKSYNCLSRNNLFGLKNKKGAYMSFTHWTFSVTAYKKYIQKYKLPPVDYYEYINKLGYAEDSNYTSKLKEIVNKQLFKYD